jgi:hypothetical protein
VLREQAETFGKEAGGKLTIDTIPHAHDYYVSGLAAGSVKG